MQDMAPIQQQEQKPEPHFDWRLATVLVIVLMHYLFFSTSFLWVLRDYEYSNKMIWVEEPQQYYPDLILYKNSADDSGHINGRFREWIVEEPITKKILVEDQFSKIKLSNAEFLKPNYDFDYILRDPSFYISKDYSVLQKRSDLRWLIKGTLINQAEESRTRIYFDIKHPNDPILKKLASNKKNLYVAILLVIFIASLVFALGYLKATLDDLKQGKYAHFMVALVVFFAVIYLLFYKLLWVWLQIQF